MKSLKHIIILLTVSLVFVSCWGTAPQYATLSKKPDLSKYRYVYVMPTSEKTLSVDTYGNKYGMYRSTKSKSVNPSDIIAGSFMKHGFARLPKICEKLQAQTIVVDYVESGRISYGLDYSIEVTIQLLDALTGDVICISTAEGMGGTETDDVRRAILKCMNAIFY